jgi:dipeptidyl aminopeptidase/acylaminoacyl peptidase
MDLLKRCSSFRLFLAAVTAVLCLHPAASAQVAPASAASATDARLAWLLDSLDRVRTPTFAAISPDGNTVAWTFHIEHGSELHLTRIAPAGPSQPAAQDRVLAPDTIADATRSKPGACTASHPAWSPDGSQLAFLSNCSDSSQNDSGGSASGQNASNGKYQPSAQQNIFVWTLAANAMKQVSHLHGEVSSLQWSPDGKSIAFLYVENATRSAGALAAMKPWNGVIGEDNVEVQRVAAVELASSAFRFVTRENLHAYEFSWSPNSSQIVFVAAVPPGENNWWVAHLYVISVGAGPAQSKEYRDSVYKNTPPGMILGVGGGLLGPALILNPEKVSGPLHGLQIAVPRFSPDGKQIAFIGGLMSDQGSTGGDIYIIPSTGLKPGDEPKNITPNRTASPAYIAWLDDHDIGISEHFGGGSRIAALDLATGRDVPGLDFTFPETIYSGDDSMSVSLASHSPNIALIRQSFARPPEVWAGPSDNLKQITHLNDAIQPAWGKAESIDYTSDGLPIQGWLLYPAKYDPSKKYPLVVSVHGGPSSALTPRWPSATYGAAPFSALGYFVFYPNPRGSFGQGERFTQANVKDFGGGDLRDILAGIDLLEKRFPIDSSREGITGWSYGGFMTMFAVTQTTRFRAAVAGAGLANWQSYYGENSIDQWMLPFFGASVYDDPAVYARSSPINFIKNVKTPTLLLVGDRDGECPAPQSFEFWHALRAVGVPAQLVVYPGEGHHFVDPAHQRDLLRRTIGWFQAQMPPK